MPKAVHELAKKLEGKAGVDNPFALANYIVNKRSSSRGKTKKRGRRVPRRAKHALE